MLFIGCEPYNRRVKARNCGVNRRRWLNERGEWTSSRLPATGYAAEAAEYPPPTAAAGDEATYPPAASAAAAAAVAVVAVVAPRNTPIPTGGAGGKCIPSNECFEAAALIAPMNSCCG